MTFPDVRIQFRPGAGPFTDPADVITYPWVDLSDRWLTASWGYGRDNELDTFRPGTGTVELKNEDRELDPEHTAGTWFGDLEPRTPFRIQTSTNGGADWDDQFYGFVQGGFEQAYRPPATATCLVTLVDLLGVLEGEVLPQDSYGYEVLQDSPVAFWRLDSIDGNEMTDSSGGGHHGAFGEVEQADPLVAGGAGAARFEHVGDYRGQAAGTSLAVPYPFTWECWFRTEPDTGSDEWQRTLMARRRDYTLATGGPNLRINPLSAAPNGGLLFGSGDVARYSFYGHTPVADGERHHAVVVITSSAQAGHVMYVDGVLQAKTTNTGGIGSDFLTNYIVTVGNYPDLAEGDFGFGGVVDEVAIYDTALSAGRALAHYNAGATAHAFEASGARVDRVLDIVGVPAALRDIATGDTTVGPADYGGASAGAYLDRIAESEQGQLYVDHHSGGVLTFRGRYDRLTAARSTGVQYAFTDEDTPDALHVEAGSLRIKPNGIDSVINVVEASWQGGTAVARDEASIDRYGPQSRSISTEAPTASAAEGAGQWLIRRYALPQTRVEGCELAPDADGRLWPAALGLGLSDRVSLRRHPQEVGAATTNELWVEGVRHTVSDGVSWRVALNLSHADAADSAWIWGTSEWGETTTWG